MRGERAQGDDALTAEEQALLDADRSNAAPVEAPESPAAVEQPEATEQVAEGAETPPEQASTQQPKMVPHQAMHEERRLRQEAERQRDEERKRSQTLEERMNIILRQMQPQQQQQQTVQPEPPPLPDLGQDPVAHLKGDIGLVRHELAQRDHILNALVQAALGQTQQTEQQRNLQMIAARATAAEREFAAQNPDYNQAYEHLVDGRRRELVAAGWSDPAEINAFMAREAAALAENALQRGLNPAAVVYDLAKIRGWQPKAPEPPAPAAGGANQPDPSAAVEQIQTIARGQQQARGINSIPGQSAAPVDANAVANMSDEEFAAWRKNTPIARQRQVLGA